ncbi:D(1)-like dopamine receptor [Limulus polyphemus]|uniref:D(1)-like dopamine receptor n=1 Tax=Limulus polyphemus TaxID=6850 RepID=A0ABM1B866_LIMPO|nr:D(1)-like dopamine receptor [Limulus polyphemus]
MLSSYSTSFFQFSPKYEVRDWSMFGNVTDNRNYTGLGNADKLPGFPEEDIVTIGEWTIRILGTCVCVLLIAMTLVGNVLVITVVTRYRRLRSVTNLLLASLASADITVAVFVMPLLVIYDLERQWRFGAIACHLWISCDVMCCTASILHLCVIALDRFWAITRPLRYQIFVSKKRIFGAVVGIWICSGAISFIPIFLGWYADGDGKTSIFEDSSECSLEVNRVYAIVSSMTSFYLPLPVMFYVYFRILLIAERQAREIKHLEVSLQTADQQVKRSLRRRSRQLITDTKAIRTLGIVMGVFCVCWLPFFLMYVILSYCEQCYLSYEWRSAITWLGYLNSSFNPCIYVFLNKEFKEAFSRVLGCNYHKDSDVTMPDDISSASRHAQRMERIQAMHTKNELNGRLLSGRHKNLETGSPTSSRKTSISTFVTDKSPPISGGRAETNSLIKTRNTTIEQSTLSTATEPEEHLVNTMKPHLQKYETVTGVANLPECDTITRNAKYVKHNALMPVTEINGHNVVSEHDFQAEDTELLEYNAFKTGSGLKGSNHATIVTKHLSPNTYTVTAEIPGRINITTSTKLRGDNTVVTSTTELQQNCQRTFQPNNSKNSQLEQNNRSSISQNKLFSSTFRLCPIFEETAIQTTEQQV